MKRWIWVIVFLIVAGLFMLGTRQTKAAPVTFALVQAQAVRVLDDRIAVLRAEIFKIRQHQECIADAPDLNAMTRCGPIAARKRS